VTNFYQQIKENSKSKVKQKKGAKKTEAEEEFALGADVYDVSGIHVSRASDMPTWVQGGVRYHLNVRGGDRDRVYHVTREGSSKTHYFFKGTGMDITAVRPSDSEVGGSLSGTKTTFKDLPGDVQDFVRGNWNDILG
jgi:hypothetical protein